jgi:hypothetical protein
MAGAVWTVLLNARAIVAAAREKTFDLGRDRFRFNPMGLGFHE